MQPVDKFDDKSIKRKYIFGMCLLFGVIGGVIFGPIGFLIGLGIGYVSGKNIAEQEIQSKSVKELNPVENNAKDELPTPSKQSSNKYKPSTVLTKYEEAVAFVVAAFVASDGRAEKPELTMASSLVRHDDLISHKKGTIEKIRSLIPDLLAARAVSERVFDLRTTNALSKLALIKDAVQKEQLILIMDALADSNSDNDLTDPLRFRTKVSEKLNANKPENTRKIAAEEYILKSGDKEAINLLREMQTNPSNYRQRFHRAAKDNIVMKTAFGVFTGFIAADLVTNAIYHSQLENALESFSTELEKMDTGNDFTFADSTVLNNGSSTFTSSQDHELEDADSFPDTEYSQPAELSPESQTTLGKTYENTEGEESLVGHDTCENHLETEITDGEPDIDAEVDTDFFDLFG